MSNDHPSPSTASHDKRDELRAKIEASERRIAERTLADQAQEAAGAATQYVKDNPLTVLGGAIAAGLIIGAMTKPGRRAAKGAAVSAVGAVGGAGDAVSGAAKGAASSVTSAAKKRGSAFGALIADALVAYGLKLIDDAMDTARASKDTAEDIGDGATAKARTLRREAGYAAGTAADKAKAATRRTRRRAERAVRDLTDRVSN